MKNCIVTFQRNDSGRVKVSRIDSERPEEFTHRSIPYATAAYRIEILNQLDAELTQDKYTMVGGNNTLAGFQRFYAQEVDSE